MNMFAWLTPERSHTMVEVAFVLFLIFCAALMIVNARNIYGLLRQGAADRKAREAAIVTLQKEALDLAQRAHDATVAHERYLRELHVKIDTNTEMTRDAATASKEAATAANSMNEKIANTNQRLLDQTSKPIHDHIDEVVDVVKDTDKKVDTLIDKKKEEG